MNFASMTDTASLHECIREGIAFHHAGLDASDRRLVEQAFGSGSISCLCATSTLAMGVNLPSHLVGKSSLLYLGWHHLGQCMLISLHTLLESLSCQRYIGISWREWGSSRHWYWHIATDDWEGWSSWVRYKRNRRDHDRYSIKDTIREYVSGVSCVIDQQISPLNARFTNNFASSKNILDLKLLKVT